MQRRQQKEADWSYAARSQEMPGATRSKKGFYPRAFEEEWVC
jgi:hypothetical protein